MVDKNLYTFIDFGTSAIRASSFNKETKKIENHLELSIKDYKSDNLLNEEKLIQDLIFSLEKKNGEYLDEVFLMLDNPNALSISITNFKKVDKQITSKDFLKYIIDDVIFEINKNYPNYIIVHTIIKKFFLDDKKLSKLPKDLNNNKIALELNFIVYPKFFIQNLKKIFANQNVGIKKIIFSSYSKSLFYLNKISYQKKIILVDIGFEKTCAFLFEDSQMKQFKILPIGGNHISKDISKILKIEISKADEIKLNFDNIDNDIHINPDEIELIKKIIFSRIEELLEISTLFSDESKELKNVKLVFFGNGSKILDNRFKSNIMFEYDIDLLDESYLDICQSGLNFIESENKEVINEQDFKEIKKGFFERFFYLFN